MPIVIGAGITIERGVTIEVIQYYIFITAEDGTLLITEDSTNLIANNVEY